MSMIRAAILTVVTLLAICKAVRAEPLVEKSCPVSGDHLTVRGTITDSVITGPPYLDIVSDEPLCSADGPNAIYSLKPISNRWLGHYVIITGTLDRDQHVAVRSIRDAADSIAPPVNLKLAKLSCSAVVGEGWNHMPDVTDYVEAQPGADKLGFASPCHIESLVFSQCWLEPRWSVAAAINALLRKAATGKELPDVPACGA